MCDDKDIKSDLGSRIKIIRGSLSQKEFADKIGAKQSSIPGWENNEKSPGSKYLEAIKNEFGVSIDWLLTGTGDIYTQEAKNIADEQIDIKRPISWLERTLNRYFQEFIQKTNNPEFQERMAVGLIAGLLSADTQKTGATEDNNNHIQKTAPDPTQASMLLSNILNSGDQVIIQALMSNLLAFNRSVERDQKQLSRIQELEERCRILEQRFENIEKRHDMLQAEPSLKKGAA